MAAIPKSIAFVNGDFVRFTNSDSVPFTEDRIRMGSVMCLVAIETKHARKSRERLLWAGRKTWTS
jgi:hypothetical protein